MVARTGEQMEYKVHAWKKFPAWDEKDGFDYVIQASSKAAAIKQARRIMADAGHTGGGCGPAYFKATEVKAD